MASTWSSLGIRLMTTGENANAWGDQTNQNWERLEDAADGLATVAVTGATTLTFTAQPTSYADENGRNKVLVFTGTAGGTQAITFPNIEKTYHVLNDSNSTLTLTTGTGAATVSLAAGKDKIIYNDGSDEIHNALANIAATTVTASGEIDGGSLDISGDADIDGTTNLDVVDIDGAVNMATTALVTGVLTTTAATVFNGGFASNAASTITTADNLDTLTLISTDADQNQGPNLRLYRNSGSPADNDILGMIDFEGRNDNSQDYIAAQIETLTSDVSDGTEDAYMNISVMHAGTLRSRIEMDSGETVFNEASQDLDFRVESNGKTHAIFVDAGNDHVGINTSDDLGGDLNVDGGIVVQNGSNLDQLSLISTDADANQGPNIRLYRNSSSPADGDTLGVIESEGRNDNSQDVIYAQIRTITNDVTDGVEDGELDIKVMNNGSLNLVASFSGPETVINDASIDHDFRVESNGNANMFKVDGGADAVLVGTGTHDGNAAFTAHSTGNGNRPAFIVNGGAVDTTTYGTRFKMSVTRDDNTSDLMVAGDNTADRFKVFSDGDVVNHDNSYGGISDQRIKQDIRDSNSQWDDIKAVKVRNYKRKDDVRYYGDEAWEQIGVIAQELEASGMDKLIKHSEPSSSDILSDAAFGTLYEDGDDIPAGKQIGDIKTITASVKKVAYSILYMKAIKALQEAQTRIETLETKVAALEG